MWCNSLIVLSFFFFNDTATTEIYTLSLHDALPIFRVKRLGTLDAEPEGPAQPHRFGEGDAEDHQSHADGCGGEAAARAKDRKSTRLNSSHANISYAVFCLKKKKKHLTMSSAFSHTY